MSDVLLEVNNLKKYFPIRSGVFQQTVGHVKAVDGISFKLKRGETIGLVGESGCGKSTVGRSIVRLHDITEGTIRFKGTDVHALPRNKLRKLRPKMQLVFQDPIAHSIHGFELEKPSGKRSWITVSVERVKFGKEFVRS